MSAPVHPTLRLMEVTSVRQAEALHRALGEDLRLGRGFATSRAGRRLLVETRRQIEELYGSMPRTDRESVMYATIRTPRGEKGSTVKVAAAEAGATIRAETAKIIWFDQATGKVLRIEPYTERKK